MSLTDAYWDSDEALERYCEDHEEEAARRLIVEHDDEHYPFVEWVEQHWPSMFLDYCNQVPALRDKLDDALRKAFEDRHDVCEDS